MANGSSARMPRQWRREFGYRPRLRDPERRDRRPGEPDRRSDDQRAAGPALPAATVLVVDDDPEVRRMVARMLADDFTVLEATNGLEALALCAHHAPAVVVTDMRMPVMGGDELGRRIAQEWPGVQVLFVTGYPTTEPGDLPGRLLIKPFVQDELVAIVRSLADRLGPDTSP